MRLIDADAFADFIKNTIKVQKYDALKVNDTTLTVGEVLETVIAELDGTSLDGFKNNPTIEPQRWIPVTERLPENACQCIVTAKVKHIDNYPDYEVDTADFADGIFTTANAWWGVESIIAWMPLPEPYKGEQE